jgi:hypothetical protein
LLPFCYRSILLQTKFFACHGRILFRQLQYSLGGRWHGESELGWGQTLARRERAVLRTIPAEPGVAVRWLPGGKQKFESAMMAVSSAVEAPAEEAVPDQPGGRGAQGLVIVHY